MIIAGSDVYAGDAIAALREAAEALRVPVFANGMGRGALPPGHDARVRARPAGPRSAAPTSWSSSARRWTSGSASATSAPAQVVHIVDAPPSAPGTSTSPSSPAGDLRLILSALADTTGDRADHEAWITDLRAAEDAAKARDAEAMAADTDPIRPARVYGELRKVLAADAVTIGDGGDFVSYAGKYLEPAQPGHLAGPGPVRLPRHRHGLRDGRAGHLPRPPGVRADGRRRGRASR